MVTILRTLRNHWKKSTVAAMGLTYLGGMVKDKIKTNNMMRVYCEEAMKFGEQSIGVAIKPRHVTVILNPKAKNSKGKNLFENHCAPLLNLAGIRVSTISTEEEGQARDLMEIMENTDAVIVAGGDGTLHEAITGLLRRYDEESATRKIAIGLAPIGKSNTLAKSLFKDFNESEAQLLAESTMAVIREVIRPVDVMKIQGSQEKPVFALTQLELGAFRDADSIISKYWYFGVFRNQMTYLISAIKGLPQSFNVDFSYLNHCPGCSKCFVKKEIQVKPSQTTTKWWSAFVPKLPATTPDHVPEQVDLSKVINAECGNWHSNHLSCSNISLATNLEKGSGNGGIFSVLHEPLESRTQFLREGFARHNEDSTESSEIRNKPVAISEAKLEFTLEEGVQKWFSIDNENYEAQNVHVTFLPSKVYMYVK